MAQKRSILKRIQGAKEVYGLIYLVLIIVSVTFVFTLPVPVEPMVESAYRIISLYGKGGPNYGKPILVMHAESYTDVLPLGTTIEAFWNHVKAIDASLVVFTAHVETGQTRVCEDELKRTWSGFPNVPEYGEKLVFLGWSVSMTMPVVYKDIWAAFGGKDYYGNDLADLPLMQRAKTLKDFEIVVSLSPWAGTRWVEMEPFGIKYLLQWAHEVSKGDIKKAIEIGWTQGGVCGPRQGLQYERLTGIPGRNSLLSSTTVIAISYIFLGIVVSNIWHWTRREKK